MQVVVEKVVYKDRIIEKPVEVVRVQEVIRQVEVAVEKVVYKDRIIEKPVEVVRI